MRRRLRDLVVQLGNHVPASAARAFGSTSRASILTRPLVNRVLPDRPIVITVRSGAAAGTKLQIQPQREKYYWAGQHEVEVQRAIVELLRPGDTFWDVGAHIGFFSLIASRVVLPSGHVHAFEPYGPSRARLQTNLDLNNAGNVSVHPQAIAAEPGLARLYAARETPMWTLVREMGEDSSIEVSCTTIDEQADVLGKPTLIKVDVEGAEVDVLRGASRLFASERPPSLIVEFTTDAMPLEAASFCPSLRFAQLTERHWILRPPTTANVGSSSGA
jgi:FkbM family methyltransferase